VAELLVVLEITPHRCQECLEPSVKSHSQKTIIGIEWEILVVAAGGTKIIGKSTYKDVNILYWRGRADLRKDE
jgi:hypothetical protein